MCKRGTQKNEERLTHPDLARVEERVRPDLRLGLERLAPLQRDVGDVVVPVPVPPPDVVSLEPPHVPLVHRGPGRVDQVDDLGRREEAAVQDGHDAPVVQVRVELVVTPPVLAAHSCNVEIIAKKRVDS